MMTINDAWGLASDRRFHNLNMPILQDAKNFGAKAQKAYRLAELTTLTTQLPLRSLSFPAFLRGESSALHELTLAEKLAGVLRYLAAPLRYEPLNLPEVHYPVSSFGGLFSCGVKLIRRTEGGELQCFHYHPSYHALERETVAPDVSSPLQPGESLIALVGQFWAVAGKYGDFSPFGVSLDGGIVSTQLSYLLDVFGVNYENRADWIADAKPLVVTRHHPNVHEYEHPLAVLSLAENRFSESDWDFLASSDTRRIACWRETPGLDQQYGLLPSLLTLFAADLYQVEAKQQTADEVVCQSPDLPDSLPEKDVFDVIRDRTASNDVTGFSQRSPIVSSQFLSDFLTVMTTLRQRRGAAPAEEQLIISIAWINQHGLLPGLYDGNGQAIWQAKQPEAFFAILQDCLFNDGQNYNLASMTMELFVSVDTGQFIQQYGDASIHKAHHAAGCLGHDVCLTASLFGGFARPVRMFRDTRLQQQLGLPGQLLMQVLVGFNRHNNFAMALL